MILYFLIPVAQTSRLPPVGKSLTGATSLTILVYPKVCVVPLVVVVVVVDMLFFKI